MGGRGGSGGTSSLAKAASFSPPSLTGTDKQKSYAEDILKNPYLNLGAGASGEEFVARQVGWSQKSRSKYDAYISAQTRYANEIKGLSQNGTISAGTVIDKRTMFSSRAKQIAQDEFKKRGIPLYEMKKDI